MELTGERLLPVDRAVVWAALNDIEILRAALPGCEKIEPTGADSYDVAVNVAIGPVKTRFSGTLSLADVKPPESYTLRFDMRGGAAGFSRGEARVRLAQNDAASTRMNYEVNASIGGKLAQIGSRLIDAAAATLADKFFADFAAALAARTPAVDTGHSAVTQSRARSNDGVLAMLCRFLIKMFGAR